MWKKSASFRVPNLFDKEQDAQLLYIHLIVRLSIYRQYRAVVDVCRAIRRHARKAANSDGGVFTFFHEIDALVDLRDYRAAWRQLLRWEKQVREEEARLAREGKEPHDMGPDSRSLYYHAPLLFLTGRYKESRTLLEAVLAKQLECGVSSYQLLCHVYKPLKEPRRHHEVTLRHIYSKLGRNLGSWDSWSRFVDGFHPKLFELTGVARETLLKDPRRIAGFFRRIERERESRLFSGCTHGEKDLTESPKKVQARQKKIQRGMRGFEKRNKSKRKDLEARLYGYFPILRKMPMPSLRR